MKKSLNIKKLLITLLIIVAIIVAIIFVINYFKNRNPEDPDISEKTPVIQLPDTTYSDMEVTNIAIEYRKQYNKTVLTFTMNNTTGKKVDNQFFTAILIGENDEILAKMDSVYIQELEIEQQHRLSVIYEGDVTATKQIKLVEK